MNSSGNSLLDVDWRISDVYAFSFLFLLKLHPPQKSLKFREIIDETVLDWLVCILLPPPYWSHLLVGGEKVLFQGTFYMIVQSRVKNKVRNWMHGY